MRGQIDLLESKYLEENEVRAQEFKSDELVYNEIIESFDEFIKLIDDKDYNSESVSEFCTMEIHDDILDTTELINDELKKYAK